jgi:hypothetical protein
MAFEVTIRREGRATQTRALQKSPDIIELSRIANRKKKLSRRTESGAGNVFENAAAETATATLTSG